MLPPQLTQYACAFATKPTKNPQMILTLKGTHFSPFPLSFFPPTQFKAEPIQSFNCAALPVLMGRLSTA